jgi:cyclopropane fatty-acyl-phospholipid synthase-like methyltransferase
MPRGKDTAGRFHSRYSLPVTDAALAVEREVIGANVGASGYTTVAQADALAPELRLRRGMLLLDIGAGRGWPGLYLARKTGCGVALVDAPAPGLATALARADEAGVSARAYPVRAAAERLPFRSGTFDAVVHTDTL